ncbi:IS1595 family transposase [Flavobacterium cerinum]|uniref:IS1595 family transposase n=1 Tax=Flavobacterium cerinum TaxID=2502784 RepID=A0A444HBW6_9FLAO|nr:IS1595 family transposase [Flavobacterium cerinum]RWX00883.1 IS1595 family transposase [Flavobacterium cerinum]
MFNRSFTSVLDVINAFPDEQACIEYLEEARWGNTVISPFDPTSKVYECKNNRFKCKNTGKYFNVRTKTIFDNSKIELQKWMIAIWLCTSHKKGMSSLQLGRDLNITQKSAWFMLQRIRNCFGLDDSQMDNYVEIDETYVGGENKNRSVSARKKLHKDGFTTGYNDKKPVLGMLERGGNVKGIVIDKSHAKTIRPILFEQIKETATVITDGHGAYKGIDKNFNDHQIVYHNKDQYVNGIFHTNTLEGFWSLLKRNIDGIHHSVSAKHLQKYVDYMTMHYNYRKLTTHERFNLLILNSDARLKYKDLIKNGED